jgi:hypothetical protein
MSEETWSAVDRFIGETLVQQDEELRAALEAGQAGGTPLVAARFLVNKLIAQPPLPRQDPNGSAIALCCAYRRKGQ